MSAQVAASKKQFSSGEMKENRKRQNSAPIECSSSKRRAPMDKEETVPLLTVENTAFKINEAVFLKRKDEKQMYAGKMKSTDGNEKFWRPAQILRNCKNIPFENIRPVLLQCTPTQKLQFIKMNMGFVDETEDIFEEMTKIDFKEEKLPSQFQHWYQYYEQLVEWKQNNEAMKLEEVRMRLAQKKKQAGTARMTKVIEVQAKSQYRASGGTVTTTAVQGPSGAMKTRPNPSGRG